LKAEAASGFEMDAVRWPASIFSRLRGIILLSVRTFPPTLAGRGNKAGQLIIGTKTPGMKALKPT